MQADLGRPGHQCPGTGGAPGPGSWPPNPRRRLRWLWRSVSPGRPRSAPTRLQARLDKAEAELHAAHNKQQAIDAGLAPLPAAAGCSDLDSLASAIDRSDQRRHIDQHIHTTAQELAHAADGYPEPELRAQASHADPDAVKAELHTLAQQSARAAAADRSP